jgi:hypothetical protein
VTFIVGPLEAVDSFGSSGGVLEPDASVVGPAELDPAFAEVGPFAFEEVGVERERACHLVGRDHDAAEDRTGRVRRRWIRPPLTRAELAGLSLEVEGAEVGLRDLDDRPAGFLRMDEGFLPLRDPEVHPDRVVPGRFGPGELPSDVVGLERQMVRPLAAALEEPFEEVVLLDVERLQQLDPEVAAVDLHRAETDVHAAEDHRRPEVADERPEHRTDVATGERDVVEVDRHQLFPIWVDGGSPRTCSRAIRCQFPSASR